MSSRLCSLCVPAKRLNGYTLAELLIVVVIIGVLASVAVVGVNSVLRREKVNSVALAMAGWFEQVRNQSANEISASDAGGGCTVKLTKNPLGSSNALVAEVVSPGCKSALTSSGIPFELRLPAVQNATYTIQLYPSTLSSTVNLAFTPRGMTKGATSDLEYRIILSDGGGPKRCVRISDITGTVEIGYGTSGTLSVQCDGYDGL